MPRYGRVENSVTGDEAELVLERLRVLYAAEVGMTDRWLGKLLESVRRLDHERETVIVLVRKSFCSLREARAWRARARVDLSLGRLDAPSKLMLAEAAERWLSEARAGVVRTRSGDRYKPSALRSYDQALRARLLPRFGAKRLSALSRPMLQQLVDELVGQGCAPSTVHNAVLPLRAIYRRALQPAETMWLCRYSGMHPE